MMLFFYSVPFLIHIKADRGHVDRESHFPLGNITLSLWQCHPIRHWSLLSFRPCGANHIRIKGANNDFIFFFGIVDQDRECGVNPPSILYIPACPSGPQPGRVAEVRAGPGHPTGLCSGPGGAVPHPMAAPGCALRNALGIGLRTFRPIRINVVYPDGFSKLSMLPTWQFFVVFQDFHTSICSCLSSSVFSQHARGRRLPRVTPTAGPTALLVASKWIPRYRKWCATFLSFFFFFCQF